MFLTMKKKRSCFMEKCSNFSSENFQKIAYVLNFRHALIRVLKFQNLAVKAFDVIIFFYKGFMCRFFCKGFMCLFFY